MRPQIPGPFNTSLQKMLENLIFKIPYAAKIFLLINPLTCGIHGLKYDLIINFPIFPFSLERS